MKILIVWEIIPEWMITMNLPLILRFGWVDGYRLVYRKSTGQVWDSRDYCNYIPTNKL